MLKQRVIFGTLGAIIAIAVLTLCSTSIIGICIGVIELIALYEFFKVTGIKEKRSPAAYTAFVFAGVSTTFVILESSYSFEKLLLAVIAFVFVLMIQMVFSNRKCTFSDCASVFLGTIYIAVFFLHVQLLRQLEHGKILIWILFIVAWTTDTFAYFSGMAFGKHKLCPKISPKKTVEGAIGGVIGCIICTELYVYIISSVNGLDFNWINAGLCALVASCMSQIGDLAASCIKRENGAKDYGNLIPGHGGVLDRFDSVLFIAPALYYLLIYLPVLK